MATNVSITQLFEPTVLTTGAATLFTAPAAPASSNTVSVVGGRVRFTNTTNTVQAVTAYAVPSGGTAGAGNCFANQEPIPANGHSDYDLPMLKAGDFIQALAGNNTAVTAFALAGTVLVQ